MTSNNLATRVRIAARRAYEKGGPGAVSARKLADELGVSQMAMYRHYRSKQELLSAVVDEGFAELVDHLRRADGIVDPVKRLEARAVHWVEFARDHPHLFRLMFSHPRSDARRFPLDFVARKSPTGVLIEDDCREAMQRAGVTARSPLELGLMLWSVMHGFAMLLMSDRLALSPTELERVCRQTVRRLLRGGGST